MVAAGLTGNKGRGGFYRTAEQGQSLARDLTNGDYRDRETRTPTIAADALVALAEQGEPLACLLAGDTPESRFCCRVLGRVLGYAASLLGSVTDSPQAIDDAMKLGFNWLRGPFEMIDALGAPKVAELCRAAHAPVADCLAEATVDFRFYRVMDNELRVWHASGEHQPLDLPSDVVRFSLARQVAHVLERNTSASLYELDNDIRLIEFHSKANALTDASMEIVAAAADNPGRGILVHNDAQHYSAGVDLNTFIRLIKAQDWHEIDAFLARFQHAVRALKYVAVPVVGAPSGLALGGGLEVLLHCDALVVHTNSVMGLVEAGVGLVPSGGGVKETYSRWYNATGSWEEAAWKTWMNLGYGATGSSPRLAAKLNYYRETVDQSVMNRDRLVHLALQKIHTLEDAYSPPQPPQLRLAGGDIVERMRTFMDSGIEQGNFYPHDKTTAMAIASVICAGDGIERDVTEDELYSRERRAFVELAQTDQTRARIEHVLTGKGALRN